MTRYHRHLHHKKHRVLIAKKQAKPLLVDRLTYGAAILEPIITIPQVVVIFQQKTAAGVSLSSWIGYEILTAIWLWYAVVHKDRLILVYQGLFFIVQGLVIAGAIMYGASW
jgi:uncharacterized protein with PQ loop repeat